MAPYNIVFGQNPNMGLVGISHGGSDNLEPPANSQPHPSVTIEATRSQLTNIVDSVITSVITS